MKKTAHQLDLLFQTSRYLTPQQILYRLYYMSRKRYWRFSGKRAPSAVERRLPGYLPLYTGFQDLAGPGPWEREYVESLGRAGRVAEQRFRFLSREVRYPDRIDWHDPGVSQLWRYHLHYFDYVEDLLSWGAAGYDALAWDAFCRLADLWIDDNEKISGDGWHPFTISVRVVNWLHAFNFWKARFDSDAEFSRRFLASLYGQVNILASSLEYDVRGNHLLKNLRALIWCGIAFDGDRAGRRLERGLSILEKELAEQILGDGGHFERAPGYHCAVLKDCIEIGLWLRRNRPGHEVRWLDDALQRMLQYLKALLPPDGKLPLLKDTTRDVTPPPGDLLAAGALYFNSPEFKISEHFGIYPLLLFGKGGWEIFRNWPVGGKDLLSASLPESSYHIMRDTEAGDFLVFDGGKVCPDYLPAHAHADMFSYELVARGQRVIVDSGVFEYSSGDWRDYFRSTAAHNTVVVDKRNQSEVWGSFRVARRARPLHVSMKQEGNHILLDAKHDGYSRLPAHAVHRRVLLWEKGRFWLVVDEVSAVGGKGAGGEVLAESHVHFHPSIRPLQIGSGHWRLEGLAFPLWIKDIEGPDHILAQGQAEPFKQGWYSENFGARVPNSVLTLYQKGSLPLWLGYMVSLDDQLCLEGSRFGAEGFEVRIKDDNHVYKLCIEPDNARYLS